MDFENVNSLNAWFNLFSGNLFPMTNRNSFSFFWKLNSVLSWVTQVVFVILAILGYIYMPPEKLFDDNMSGFGEALDALMVVLQTWFICLRIHTHKDVMYQLIEKLNEMLHITDEIMKNIVPSTLGQVKTSLSFYWFSNMVAIMLWGSLEFLLILEKDQFYYEDFGVPMVFFSKQPFSRTTYLLGCVFMYISSIYMILKKICVDIYVVHLVLMVTAQYKYIGLKFATICQEKNESNELGKKNFQEVNRRKGKEIKALCRHHKNVLHTITMLKTILSLNFTLTYMTSIFRFSFIGILISGVSKNWLVVPSSNIFEAVWIIMYAVGVAVQLYILCFSVQQLLDASTEVTDHAFHESWYLLQPSVKRIFFLTIMANNLDSKISSIDKFNLSLPSFMTILNQAYSIALLFLKMK